MSHLRTDPNVRRAKRPHRILPRRCQAEDLSTSLIDLLADFLHWCDHHGEDFHCGLAQAGRRDIHELNDQHHNTRRLSS